MNVSMSCSMRKLPSFRMGYGAVALNCHSRSFQAVTCKQFVPVGRQVQTVCQTHFSQSKSSSYIQFSQHKLSRVLSARSCQTLASPFDVESVPTPSTGQSDIIFADEILKVMTPSCNKGSIFLDLTFGTGGHTQLILDSDPDVKVIAVDRDPSTKEAAQYIKDKYPGRFCFLNIKFSGVARALFKLGIKGKSICGVVLDAGPSLDQLTDPRRGFGNTSHYKLDMRMDGPDSNTMSALNMLQHIDEDHLYRVLRFYGNNKQARKLARAVVQARFEMIDINTPHDLISFTKQLKGLNTEEIDENKSKDGGGLHPAAQSVFQSLRIIVNDEINELDCGIKAAHYLLRDGGLCAAITYNSLEDTIVKRHFKGMNIDASPNQIGLPQHRVAKMVGLTQHEECQPWTSLVKHVLTPPPEVKESNPTWRRAELRVAATNAHVTYDG